VNNLKTICVCGHDQATHFKNAHACLGMRCDCKEYDDHLNPKAKRRVSDDCPDTPRSPGATKPHADTTCNCPACVAWLRQKWGGWAG
jgi:hypothetical protein